MNVAEVIIDQFGFKLFERTKWNEIYRNNTHTF